MSVVTKYFDGTINKATTTNITLKHTLSDGTEVTKNVSSTNPEACLFFLNSLYQTLIEAGYNDTVVNEDDYSITILGEKIYFIVGNSVVGSNSGYYHVDGVYITNYDKIFDSKIMLESSSTTSYCMAYNDTNISYSITIRGDENHVGIYMKGSYNSTSLNNEVQLLHIFKMKNIHTQNDAILLTNKINGSGVYVYAIKDIGDDNNFKIIESSINVSSVTNATGLFMNYAKAGNNTYSKYSVIPMLAFYGSYTVPSMICNNSAILKTDGEYYKIGRDIYFLSNGSLFKVD